MKAFFPLGKTLAFVVLATLLMVSGVWYGTVIDRGVELERLERERQAQEANSKREAEERALREKLTIVDSQVGIGAEAETGDTLSVHYTGTFPDGKQFESTLDSGTPFEFILGSGKVIRGWDLGIQGMRVYGKRRLVIPPEFAYGERGSEPLIPPNATLQFEIELLGIRGK